MGDRRRWNARPTWRVAALALASLGVAATPAAPQWTAAVTVEESAGIRRTAFPTRIELEIPEGRLEYVSQVGLASGGDPVPAQGTAVSTWPDGSVRDLEVDFNVSLGPFEQRRFEVSYGPDVSGGLAPGRGLVAVQEGRGVQVGSVTLSDVGSPLLAAVAYREELIGVGRNGINIVERSGIRRDAREITWEPVEIVKGGPVAVLLRYRGRLTLSGGNVAEITLDVAMPNSKSWLEISARVTDPGMRVGDLAIETPLALGAYPWTWDFGTPNGTYGAFRDPTGSVIYRGTLDEGDAWSWEIDAGAAGSETPYERSGPAGDREPLIWAHLVGESEAVAFAVEAPTRPGTVTAWLTGSGQTTVSFRSAEPAAEHELTLYQHYVAAPVPIGAATSPASILGPLRVRVE